MKNYGKCYITAAEDKQLLGDEFPAREVSLETRRTWTGECFSIPSIDMGGDCWGCENPSCPCAEDTQAMVRFPRLGTIRGRHEMPVDGYILNEAVVNPADVQDIEAQVRYNLKRKASVFGGRLSIFVTGLTVVTIAVIKAAADLGLDITLYHYDAKGDTYFPQHI